MNQEYLDYKKEEMRAEARYYLQDCLREEFNQAYNEFELAKLFVENGDDELSFEEFCEMEFEHYCEDRTANWGV